MDLLKQMGEKKKTSSTQGSEVNTSVPQGAAGNVGEHKIGEDLFSGAQKPSDTAATESKGDVEGSTGENHTQTSSKDEPSGSSTVKDPDSWTKESALKEVIKAREEAKNYRLKMTELAEQAKKEAEAAIKRKEDEMSDLIQAKKELAKIKAAEEDKKRDLNEKLSHRESLIAEMQAKLEMLENESSKRVSDLESQIAAFQAEADAVMEVHRNSVKDELNAIPEKFRDIADLIVKGAGDPRDALIKLKEAKIKGLFEDKTVVVNHSVPGANDGARLTSDKMQEKEKARKAKLTSTQKISEGLNNIRKGEGNSIFTGRLHK